MEEEEERDVEKEKEVMEDEQTEWSFNKATTMNQFF